MHTPYRGTLYYSVLVHIHIHTPNNTLGTKKKPKKKCIEEEEGIKRTDGATVRCVSCFSYIWGKHDRSSYTHITCHQSKGECECASANEMDETNKACNLYNKSKHGMDVLFFFYFNIIISVCEHIAQAAYNLLFLFFSLLLLFISFFSASFCLSVFSVFIDVLLHQLGLCASESVCVCVHFVKWVCLFSFDLNYTDTLHAVHAYARIFIHNLKYIIKYTYRSYAMTMTMWVFDTQLFNI